MTDAREFDTAFVRREFVGWSVVGYCGLQYGTLCHLRDAAGRQTMSETVSRLNYAVGVSTDGSRCETNRSVNTVAKTPKRLRDKRAKRGVCRL